MRKFVLRLAALAGGLVTLGACSDSPTAPAQEQQRALVIASGGAVQDQQVQGCVSDGPCILDPIVVDPGECDPWVSLDWCSGGGECITSFDSTDATVQSCPGTGGGGGGPGGGGTAPSPPGGDPGTDCPTAGTSTCPSEPPPPDTCRTGDQVVDDADVWGEFQNLWNVSIASGTERGGWVVRDGTNSYRLVPFQNAAYGPCGIDVYEVAPPGTVSIVHTHPWPLFKPNPCGYLNTGTPSPADIQALQLTGLTTGYFLDANGIGKYTGTGGEQANRVGRCGY